MAFSSSLNWVQKADRFTTDIGETAGKVIPCCTKLAKNRKVFAEQPIFPSKSGWFSEACTWD